MERAEINYLLRGGKVPRRLKLLSIGSSHSAEARHWWLRSASIYAVAPKFTDTSLETPGSCMVTPYITGAMLMVFLL
jgi:hypothetical protein